ncbi:MAG: 4'-phosphopantetheinyl transferase superfamily protein [Verrucomicrobia bacterium]|nr:MAG: 4'-phosphopantetheinyl transferase superfamily protein [Verrucomicrobiota bacterium]
MKTWEQTSEYVIHDSPDEPVEDFERVHVWFSDLDAAPQLDFTGPSGLSANERARVARLKIPLERWRFAARCHFVRHVLGGIVGVAPASLKFRNGLRGKPWLSFPIVSKGDRFAVLDFNLAHAENILALAVAFNRKVGIDIEIVKPGVEFLGVAENFFAPEECNRLRTLPPTESIVAFDHLWTRKEALAKASGLGVAVAVSRETLHASAGTELHSFDLKLGETQIVGALAIAERSGESEAAEKISSQQCEQALAEARLQRRNEDLGNFWLQRQHSRARKPVRSKIF